MRQRENFINTTLEYYQHLKERFNKGYEYIENMAKNKRGEEIYDTREYKAYKEIIRELSELEDIIKSYSIFENINI
ncbi:hypothetical protein [Terrisporobacter sp.]|uniref:hypothetical protein n=1 Tax=Terrisporobacter sp. TaxID=1965305 RepID=UPI00260BFCA6|nr:hypothetical protein [Terrisporobacter sp.]